MFILVCETFFNGYLLVTSSSVCDYDAESQSHCWEMTRISVQAGNHRENITKSSNTQFAEYYDYEQIISPSQTALIILTFFYQVCNLCFLWVWQSFCASIQRSAKKWNFPPRPEGARRCDSRNLGPTFWPIPVHTYKQRAIMTIISHGKFMLFVLNTRSSYH